MRALLTLSFACLCVSAHAGGVYFSDRQGSVRAIDFGSVTARTLGSASDPRGIVFDPVTERVYYLDRVLASLNSYAAAGAGFATHLTNISSAADLRPDRVNRIFYWCQETGGLIRKAPFTATGDAAVVATTVFSGLSAPYYLDLDLPGSRIFWSQNGTGLFSGPLAGGSVSTVYTGGANNRGIAADAAAGMLYWCQRGNPGPTGVFRRGILGGSVQTIYGSGSPTNTLLNTPHGLLLDLPAGKLYWADTGTNGFGLDGPGVYRGDLDGSTTREMVFGGVSNQTWDLDLDTRTPNYTEWKARFFRFDAPAAITDKTADADTDGDPNLAEYAFGTGPLNGQSRLVLEPLRVVDGSAEYGAVRFRRRIGATDLTYRVQVSTNLVSWPDNTTTPGTTVQHGAPIPAEDGMEVVTIRSTAPANSEIRQFIRVQVTSP